MEKINVVLGVLTAMYAAYIGVALWWSRSRNRFLARKQRYGFIPGRNRAMTQSRRDRVVIDYR